MRVNAKSLVRRFLESRKNDFEVARRGLLTWFKLAESAEWANLGALKQASGSGYQVVFDVGNNRYRRIGRAFYAAGKLFIVGMMDHQDYDKSR